MVCEGEGKPEFYIIFQFLFQIIKIDTVKKFMSVFKLNYCSSYVYRSSLNYCT